MHGDGDGEISAIDAEFFVGREWKSCILTRRILNFSQHDVGGKLPILKAVGIRNSDFGVFELMW